jgi:hypothetical protein
MAEDANEKPNPLIAGDANDKELTVLGFAKGMRAGLVTFMLALQTAGIIYLFTVVLQTQKEKYDDQAQRYKDMINFLQPAKDHMNAAADKVNTAADRAIVSSNTVDSLTNELNKRKIKK